MGDIAVDIFLETLKQLITNSKLRLIIGEKHQLQSLEMEIKYLREFFKVTEKKRNEHIEVMNLVRQIRDVVFESENTVELFVSRAYKQDRLSGWDKFFEWFRWDRFWDDQDDLFLDLESVKKEIKTLKAKVKRMYDENIAMMIPQMDSILFQARWVTLLNNIETNRWMASGDDARANWKDPELYKLFIDLCLKESTENGKNGISLKKESWDRILIALNNEKGLNLTQKQSKRKIFMGTVKRRVSTDGTQSQSQTYINLDIGSLETPSSPNGDAEKHGNKRQKKNKSSDDLDKQLLEALHTLQSSDGPTLEECNRILHEFNDPNAFYGNAQHHVDNFKAGGGSTQADQIFMLTLREQIAMHLNAINYS
ncbi:hypothetical protein RHGRI_035125 [Rhododendron griersonianum]|uniref:Myb/SANT-like domain-containing protein n=1 Tax=Rhododendron griersonianum TaxID=479676 RepID=A0AAV6I6R5_9ERIC|nr:hypothetical protein RHGRI_035125 [Rhododendron griersonianum]